MTTKQEAKKCSVCTEEKPLTEFYKEFRRNGQDGLWHSAKCKECKDAYIYAYRRNNRERYNGYMRNRRLNVDVKAKELAKDKERYHAPDGVRKAQHKAARKRQIEKGYDIEYLYGITLEQRTQMFEAQKGKCLLCETHESDLKRKLCIDHCHASKRVRGLICDECNKMLGHAKDRIDVLEKAVAYLKA